jgi:hypothetical protein
VFSCRGCGYDLARIRTTTCPECGLPFDPFREETIVRGQTPFARWWHRQRHPDYAGFLPAPVASGLAAIRERLGDVALGPGIVLPILPAWIGIEAVVTATTWLPGRHHRRLELVGQEAVTLGVAWICLAGALHMFFVWGRMPRAWRVAQPLAILLSIAATAGLLVTIGGAFIRRMFL